jgi:hypothetical protein
MSSNLIYKTIFIGFSTGFIYFLGKKNNITNSDNLALLTGTAAIIATKLVEHKSNPKLLLLLPVL